MSIRARMSATSCGRSTSSLESTLRANRWPARATGTVRDGHTSTGRAAATSSLSIPEEASSRSTMIPCSPSPRGNKRAVASRPVACCSTIARTRYPRPNSEAISASAARSLATATATSRSRVNRGFARTETARPPTSAQRAPHAARSTPIPRRAFPSLVRARSSARQSELRPRRRRARRVARSATPGATARFQPRRAWGSPGAISGASARPRSHASRRWSGAVEPQEKDVSQQ